MLWRPLPVIYSFIHFSLHVPGCIFVYIFLFSGFFFFVNSEFCSYAFCLFLCFFFFFFFIFSSLMYV